MSAHLNSLLLITQLLSTKPSLDELCNFLSLKHCPSGEVSRVYVGKILDENNLRVEAAHGFEPENCYVGKVFPLVIGRPSGRAILENKIIIEVNKPTRLARYH